MRTLRLLALTVSILVLTEVFCEEISPNQVVTLWAASDHSQDQKLQPDSVRDLLKRVARKPRPGQFFGLMGRRSFGHKLENFVGLMGKRSSAADFPSEWKTVQTFVQRR
ncbi:protachykinin-like isoform X2 [Scyliorhinus torazame]|uniref:protachykinin-like isoform X2 n=1 Tax=Scyliorhinus torazame TaxID=75743 RepID=UPI003B5A2B68